MLDKMSPVSAHLGVIDLMRVLSDTRGERPLHRSAARADRLGCGHGSPRECVEQGRGRNGMLGRATTFRRSSRSRADEVWNCSSTTGRTAGTRAT
eukprot:CAMPEP_0204349792 /NCGR_PEP_ID=MMETSP0469-20131031/29816_1 /ASSEMBLY_ACC=CAM_ASM_000384 /TAXON_ID=2969 /ORGANISM="Oxyrrhis marina" /LENGTH=94 /DNA_ID=CAMNT_0051336041 /DNA_START=195 /DNA_END=475 /DNA_ORIENTATION=-